MVSERLIEIVNGGDANTAYFHRVANMRHRINIIHSLTSPEGRTIVGIDIKIHILEYF